MLFFIYLGIVWPIRVFPLDLSSMRVGTNYPYSLAQFLAQRKCSMNLWWMNIFMSLTRKRYGWEFKKSVIIYTNNSIFEKVQFPILSSKIFSVFLIFDVIGKNYYLIYGLIIYHLDSILSSFSYSSSRGKKINSNT